MTCVRWRISTYLLGIARCRVGRRSVGSGHEPVGHGGGDFQVGVPCGRAQARDVGLGSSGKMRVPGNLDHGAAAAGEVLLDAADLDLAALALSRLGDITTTIWSASCRIPRVADSRTPVPVSRVIRL